VNQANSILVNPQAARELIDKPLGYSGVENPNVRQAMSILDVLGYKYELTKINKIKVIVLSSERPGVMSELLETFTPFGFKHDPLRGGTHGTIKKISRKDGSAFIVVKPNSSAGRAASLGAEYEKELADMFHEIYGDCGITALTAGFAHGSDLIINGPEKSITVEIKTASGADFGQFRLVHNPSEEIWTPTLTEGFKKNKSLFTGLFEGYLENYLNEFAKFPDLSDPRIKMRKGLVTGLSANDNTGEYKKELQDLWFKDRADLIVPVSFEDIVSYYKSKGDKLIQIGGRGLYAFEEEDSKRLKIPLFRDKGKTASIRFRLKPEMSVNGHHSFTVAVKLTIEKSESDLTDDDSIENIAISLL